MGMRFLIFVTINIIKAGQANPNNKTTIKLHTHDFPFAKIDFAILILIRFIDEIKEVANH